MADTGNHVTSKAKVNLLSGFYYQIVLKKKKQQKKNPIIISLSTHYVLMILTFKTFNVLITIYQYK